jgi:hypothetical protein
LAPPTSSGTSSAHRPEILALLEELLVLLVVERRRLTRGETLENVLLERHQLVAHELLHEVA